MNFNSNKGQLALALRELNQLWSETKESWNDSSSEKFEKEVIEPLEADLRSAIDSMSSIEVSLQKMSQVFKA